MKYLLLLFILFYSISFSKDLFQKTNSPAGPMEIWNIAVDGNGVVFVDAQTGLFKSVDNCKSWTRIVFETSGVFDYNIQFIETTENNNLIVFCNETVYQLKENADTAKPVTHISEIEFYDVLGNSVIVANRESIKLSENAGDNWTEINATNQEFHNKAIHSVQLSQELGVVKVLNDTYYWDFNIIPNLIYYTKNNGNIWYELRTLPGIQYRIQRINVIDDYKFLVYDDEYSFHSGQSLLKLIDIEDNTSSIIENVESEYLINARIYKLNGFYFAHWLNKVYKSIDGGNSWIDFSDSIYTTPYSNYSDAFTIDSKGNIYSGNRYSKMRKSTDGGNSWFDVNINVSPAYILLKLKCFGNNIYTLNYPNAFHYTPDKGNTWYEIPLPEKDVYYSDYSINKNGKIALSTYKKVYISGNNGLSWSETDSIKNFDGITNIRFLDDGRIIVYATRNFIIQADGKTVIKPPDSGVGDAMQLDDGRLLGKKYNSLYLADSNLVNSKKIDYGIDNIMGYTVDVYDFIVSKDNNIFAATERGLFVSNGIADSWSEAGFLKKQVKWIQKDTNDVLFVYVNDTVFCSYNLGSVWYPIFPKGYTNGAYFVFGDRELLNISQDVFYGKLESNNFLSIKMKSSYDYNYSLDTLGFYFTVKNLSDLAVPDCKIIIHDFNSNSNDTIMTDSYGQASIIVNLDKVDNNNNVRYSYWAEKDDYYSKRANYIQYMVFNKFKNIYLTFFPTDKIDWGYVLQSPDSKVRYTYNLNEKNFGLIKGKIVFRNELLDRDDTFDFDVSANMIYEFKIPKETPFGMYKIKVSGNDEHGNVTMPVSTYLVVTDEFPQYISVDEEPQVTEENIFIFPNPAGDYIHIRKPSEGWQPSEGSVIRIYNTLGQCVMAVEIQNFESLRIDIGNLQPGVYSLNLGGKAKMFVKGR